MAEDEDDLSASEMRKLYFEGRERRKAEREEYTHKKAESTLLKRLREESLLRITLLKAARKHHKMFEDLIDYVPAIGVSIGGYSRFSGKDVSVTACFSYSQSCLNWDIVEGPLRRLILIPWAHIGGLELKLNESGLACLTVEMKRSDHIGFQLYKPESNRWSASIDFTHDVIWHNSPTHYVLFKPGTVDESYEMFLNYRKELASWNEKNRQQCEKQFEKKQLRRKLRKLSASESESEKEEIK